jgi:acyl dehydratase
MTTETSSRSEPTVGKVLPDLEWTVTPALIQDYFAGLALDRSAFDRGEVPVPTMIATAADNYHEHSRFQQDKGHLWMRQQWEFKAPLRVGETYVTHAHIEDIYERRDRTVVNTAVSVVDANGETALTSNHHQSFLLNPPVNEVEFRDPTKKEGARKFIVPEGDPIAPLDRTITLEMCGQYFHGSTSYHTDLQASQSLGFSDVVVGGRMTMSYLGHLLDGHFGAPWWTSGILDVKFTNPTWPDDHITVKGVATGPTEDDPSRDGVFAWIEKDDGTIVLIATASVAR